MDASEYAKGTGRIRLRSRIDVTGPRRLTIRSVAPGVTTIEMPTIDRNADTVTDLAAEVRSYFIPDFTDWTNADTYNESFQRLLNDLREES